MKTHYYAHSLPNEPATKWQPLETHLHEVSRLSASFADAFDGATLAGLAGHWHDLGKYSEAFQRYVSRSDDQPDGSQHRPGSVDHSTAGAQHAVQVFRERGIAPLGYLLAYAIAGHHAGLPVGNSPDDSCLYKRLSKQIEDYSAAPNDILHPAELVQAAPTPQLNRARSGFDVMFFVRMLYSALVDADYIDTERFLRPERTRERQAITPNIPALTARLGHYTAELATSAADGGQPGERARIVYRSRQDVLSACRKGGSLSPGFFTLTVPTGGGKTLSSLTFALEHARIHGHERVIYAVPFTTIIEQTAERFREAMEHPGERVVLEHHSAFVTDESDLWSRLATENWEAPIIVTTNVQFFESLFGRRSSKLRKLHNIAGSVIILDEAQMLPPGQLRPTIEALRTLVRDYGCSVVFCTATQPALEKRDAFPHGISDARELAPDPVSLHDSLRRVQVEELGYVEDEDLVFRLCEHRQLLCIVNTKRHATELYRRLIHETNRDDCFHLSAGMCAEHRTRVLREVTQRLRHGEPCRVVATQVVEAGVDIDFPLVYRARSGLDSIAQAAGRCNREGRLEGLGVVRVFEPEAPIPPGALRRSAQITRRISPDHDDLLSLGAVEHYFRELLFDRDLDEDAVFALSHSPERAQAMNFDFPEIAARYRLIRDDGEPLIVPFDKRAEQEIRRLRHPSERADAARKLQRYSVQVRTRYLDTLRSSGQVEAVAEHFWVIADMKRLYDNNTGLVMDADNPYLPQELMV